MGLLCAEQNVGNLQHLALRNSGTPMRRTKGQKYQNMHFQKFRDSCAQNNTSKYQKSTFMFLWTPACRTKHRKFQKPVNFVLVLNKVHVLALNTAHVMRLKKADVLALNKAHVLRLNTKICPLFTANTKEAAFGRLHKGGEAFGRPPLWFPLCWL